MIRDTTTGLFSSGGYHPHWLPMGKRWYDLVGSVIT
jgi:hypothetical protein